MVFSYSAVYYVVQGGFLNEILSDLICRAEQCFIRGDVYCAVKDMFLSFISEDETLKLQTTKSKLLSDTSCSVLNSFVDDS